MNPTPHPRLIAVGNPFWRDDAAGIAVARLVRAAAPASIEVVELGGDPASLLEALTDAGHVVIVDAVRSSATPGTIHRIEIADAGQLPDHRPHGSSHTLALGDLLALARTLDRLPGHLVLIGIEAAKLGPGTSLSPRVAAAVQTVARQALRDLQADETPALVPAPQRGPDEPCRVDDLEPPRRPPAVPREEERVPHPRGLALEARRPRGPPRHLPNAVTLKRFSFQGNSASRQLLNKPNVPRSWGPPAILRQRDQRHSQRGGDHHDP